MKLALVAIAGAAIVAAAIFASLYFWAEPATKTVVTQPCGERTFGHIESLIRKGDRFELRFDPAWFTSGQTANTAAAEDGAVEPGEPVPNDNYVIEEGHRLLTYLVRPTAQVTVLTDTERTTGNLYATPITVAELAQLVQGEGEEPVKLFEGLDSGFWLRVQVDTACALDQQYRP